MSNYILLSIINIVAKGTIDKALLMNLFMLEVDGGDDVNT